MHTLKSGTRCPNLEARTTSLLILAIVVAFLVLVLVSILVARNRAANRLLAGICIFLLLFLLHPALRSDYLLADHHNLRTRHDSLRHELVVAVTYQLPLACVSIRVFPLVHHYLDVVLHHLLHQRARDRRRVVAGRRGVHLDEPGLGVLRPLGDHEVVPEHLEVVLTMLHFVLHAEQRVDDGVLALLHDDLLPDILARLCAIIHMLRTSTRRLRLCTLLLGGGAGGGRRGRGGR
mmetsp:Transcript_49409/g.132654  ORF Transcript_49409/g.132654 Transcript_49409/m.132654 type:complete len:234 (+) Transcript_49409:15-716(+)